MNIKKWNYSNAKLSTYECEYECDDCDDDNNNNQFIS